MLNFPVNNSEYNFLSLKIIFKNTRNTTGDLDLPSSITGILFILI